METHPKKYGSFQDLEVYKTAREFRRKIYQLAKQLPVTENYNLNIQMRRATLSLTNNIAEGHGRFHFLDNIRFVLISRGSLTELIDDLSACKDENYAPAAQLEALNAEGANLMRLINGYVRYLRESKSGDHLGLREESVRYLSREEDNSLDEFPT